MRFAKVRLAEMGLTEMRLARMRTEAAVPRRNRTCKRGGLQRWDLQKWGLQKCDLQKRAQKPPCRAEMRLAKGGLQKCDLLQKRAETARLLRIDRRLQLFAQKAADAIFLRQDGTGMSIVGAEGSDATFLRPACQLLEQKAQT